MSSKYNDEERVMHSESDNIEIMSHDKGDEFLEESSGGLSIDSSYSLKNKKSNNKSFQEKG